MMPAAARYSNLHIVVCVAGGMQFSKRIRDGLDHRFFCIGPGAWCRVCHKNGQRKKSGDTERKKLPTVCCVRLQMHKLRQNIGY